MRMIKSMKNRKKLKVKIVEPTVENRNIICPFDLCKLVNTRILHVEDMGDVINVQTRICPLCYRRYISVKKFKDMSAIRIGPWIFYNLNLKKKTKREKIVNAYRPDNLLSQKKHSSNTASTTAYKTVMPNQQPVSKAEAKTASSTISVPTANEKSIKRISPSKETNQGYVVWGKLRKINTCLAESCNSELDNIFIRCKSKKGKLINHPAKMCPVCGKLVVQYTVYLTDKDIMQVLNESEVFLYEEAERKKKEEKRRLAEQKEQERKQRQKQRMEQEIRRQEDKGKKIADAQKKSIKDYERIRNDAKKRKGIDPTDEICLRDFLIKRNVFRCIHNEHTLQDITASIMILNQSGNIETLRVKAGYCRDCNVYFIFDDDFKRIQKRGTPICRVYDWKTIESREATGDMILAPESLLRQYGYNVNATEGLSSKRRKLILQILVDNNIMTKSEIISYLDFFISQRKNNSAMRSAIEKWESDKTFIEDYKIGPLQNYKIGSLSK